MENKKILIVLAMFLVIFAASHIYAAPTQQAEYIINTSASEINITFEENALNDTTTSKNMTFDIAGDSSVVYIESPKNATATSAKANFTGLKGTEEELYNDFNFVTTAVEYLPESVAGNGTYLWVVGRGEDKIWKYWYNGTYTGDSWPYNESLCSNAYDIDVDNANNIIFLACKSDARVMKYNKQGTYLSHWDTGTHPDDPSGIAVNGTSVFLQGSYDEKVYQYDYNGNELSTITLYGIADDDGYGMEFNGTHFWINIGNIWKRLEWNTTNNAYYDGWSTVMATTNMYYENDNEFWGVHPGYDMVKRFVTAKYPENITIDVGLEEKITYQEDANSSNTVGFWSNSTNLTDGNWDNYADPNTAGYLYLNYSKDIDEDSALWRVGYGAGTVVNTTIPSDCFDYNSTQIMLRLYAINSGINQYHRQYCYNGTWKQIVQYSGGTNYRISEEAVWYSDDDGYNDYVNTTIFSSAEEIDLNITAINNALAGCTADENGVCSIGINITTQAGASKIEISSINLTYTYDLVPLFSVSSDEDGQLIAGGDFNHTAIITNTAETSQAPVNLTGYYLNYSGDVPDSCEINGSSGNVTGSPAYCDFNFSFSKGDSWHNHTIVWSKGTKITKTDIETVMDTDLNSDLRVECTGYGTGIDFYYWNTTFNISNTDSANYTSIFWSNNLEGAQDGYAEAVLNGTIASLTANTNQNATSRYRTNVLTAIETVEQDTPSVYEKQIQIDSLTGIDSAFLNIYYVNTKVNVSINSDFTNYNFYWWNGIAWEKHTETVSYNFSIAGSYAFFEHDYSAVSEYYAVSSETPSADPVIPPTGGGGGGEPTVIIVSGNWSILQPNFYLLAAPNSVTTSYITINNMANNEIETIEVECLPSTCRETDPCSCVNLCHYVTFGEDLVYVKGKPFFQAYQIKPGQSGKLPFTINFSQEFAAENNLPSIQACFYSFSIAVTINEITQPVSATVVALPGMSQLGGGLSWLQRDTLIIPGPYPVYIPNWLLSIILMISIIIVVVIIYRVLKKPKKRVIKWWQI